MDREVIANVAQRKEMRPISEDLHHTVGFGELSKFGKERIILRLIPYARQFVLNSGAA